MGNVLICIICYDLHDGVHYAAELAPSMTAVGWSVHGLKAAGDLGLEGAEHIVVWLSHGVRESDLFLLCRFLFCNAAARDSF
jgi:hypothetical protein